MAGGIREVSGGIPTLERRSPLLWLEQDDSPKLPALNLKGIFLGRAFLVPVSRLQKQYLCATCGGSRRKNEVIILLCPNATGQTPNSPSNESTQLGGKAGDKWGPRAGRRVRGVYSSSQRGVNREPKQMVETGQTCGSLKYSALVHPENLQI